ncbi:calmodulin-like protein 3 [Benincasa hispida]|uniref:calmodulin-like protein 3 n=1 Tax=Benincasa hispida TaxID=102211 RepID=UPI001900BA66|nr:calmodulin-like protein 3 [Benincasa hispida]
MILTPTAIAAASTKLPPLSFLFFSINLPNYCDHSRAYNSSWSTNFSIVDVESLCTMSPLNSSDLQRIFETIDRNGDGFVSMEELNLLLNRIGVDLASEDLESLTGKSKIDLNEFLCLYESISEKKEGENRGSEEVESDLLNAFMVFDENRDGFISCDELENVLVRLGLWNDERCGGCGGDYCRRMIGAFDMDLDGRIDFQEFKNMMNSSNSPS